MNGGLKGRTLKGALQRAHSIVALLAAGLCAVSLGVLALLVCAANALNPVSTLHLMVIGLFCIVLSIGLGTLVALFLSRRMLRELSDPLRNLARVAGAARHEHTFEQRVPPAVTDDLDDLGSNVNALLDELETLQGQALGSHIQQANLDHLTGLPNRAFFEGRLARNLRGAEKQQGQLAVLSINCDHFKAINDHHGHGAADDVLISIAGRLRTQLREHDLLARLGGDGFAVLLSPLHGTDDAQTIADKIVASLLEPVSLPDGGTLKVSLSAGLALFPEHARAPAELMAAADAALRQAKHQGRSCWRLAAPITQPTV